MSYKPEWLDRAEELRTMANPKTNKPYTLSAILNVLQDEGFDAPSYDHLRKTLKKGGTTDSPSRFFMKARTIREICKKYELEPDKALELAEKPDDGLTLFSQRNDFNEPVYIWLPITQKDVEILPRKWDLKVADDEDPYMWAQFHEKVDEIRIVPLFDVHYGHSGHKHEKFLAYIRWIEETPGIYCVLGGDLMENALDDGRGYSYEQDKKPQRQVDDLIDYLAPIAHKIICITPGNHEDRTYKRTGIDPSVIIAKQLKIPYFSGPVIVDFLWKGYRWGAHIFHGRGNSQTKGGKHNAAARPVRFTENLQFYLSGHTHDPMANSETRLVRDALNCRLVEQTFWVLVAPSFLRWKGTYAYKAGYSPPGKGGVAMVLYPNGDYRADFV